MNAVATSTEPTAVICFVLYFCSHTLTTGPRKHCKQKAMLAIALISDFEQ